MRIDQTISRSLVCNQSRSRYNPNQARSEASSNICTNEPVHCVLWLILSTQIVNRTIRPYNVGIFCAVSAILSRGSSHSTWLLFPWYHEIMRIASFPRSALYFCKCNGEEIPFCRQIRWNGCTRYVHCNAVVIRCTCHTVKSTEHSVHSDHTCPPTSSGLFISW